MNKFHLIHQMNKEDTEKTKEISDFIKRHPNKILYFNDVNSYTSKLKNALSK